MNFYFCETCGKRVTDTDIQVGAGRDKKLKGVYCSSCAVGVMTVEMDAIADPNPKRSATPAAKNVHTRTTGEMEPLAGDEPKHAAPRGSGALQRPAKLNEAKATTHASAARITPVRKSPASTSHDRSKSNFPVLLGAGSLAVILLAVFFLTSSPPKPPVSAKKMSSEPAEPKKIAEIAPKLERSGAPDPTPAAVTPVVAVATPPAEPKPAPAAKSPDVAEAPVPGGPLFEQKTDDIRESLAKEKLDEIEQLWKASKLTPAQLRVKYSELAESSYKTTKAGQQAADELRKLGPEPAATPAVAQAQTPPAQPAPPAPAQPATPATPPAPAKPATPANAAHPVTGKSVWWEGESAVEHNFVSHLWLAEQLDKKNLSGGKYLNQLYDENWIRQNGKTPTKNLHAKYVIDVPADATYTLWSREYDPYCGVLWKFKWDDGQWFSVPATYPFENRVEIGKDRPLAWRNFPNQTLKKGKHTFYLEATIEGIHSIAGFDCFYLTTDPFKPDGAKKPEK